MRPRIALRALFFAALAALSACDENASTPVDGSLPRDLPLADNAPADATLDAPADVTLDAPADVTSDAPSDAPVDAWRDAGDGATCFAGTPRARVEFLNRCTDAETASKTVVLPLRRADGTLPPLP